MNTFVNAIQNQEARTENDMKARKGSASACVDLFYKIGASRGQNIIPQFVSAYVENNDVALRIVQWGRDVREGAGERKAFRDIMLYMEGVGHLDSLFSLMRNTAEIGRWDDLLIFNTDKINAYAYSLIRDALKAGNGLCAKWMPRKGPIAMKLRNFLMMSPREYRKTLVELTKVVETPMCANEWDGINFSSVPSVAHTRYKHAFARHTPAYHEYLAKLASGDKSVKVNAGAVYPHNVLADVIGLNVYGYHATLTEAQQTLIIQQWKALENFIGDALVLPMVDVSGSMYSPINLSTTAAQVALSLGLYLADKNSGPFKDTFLTFSGNPELLTLKGNILQKLDQMSKSKWGMNTNLSGAIDKILSVAVNGAVSNSDMPKMLVILSDMQFDRCVRFDDSAMEAIRRRYIAAGYDFPVIVFWNLLAKDNMPVRYDEKGVVLVSGFSPSIMKSILACDIEGLTPEAVMLKTVMKDRYKLQSADEVWA